MHPTLSDAIGRSPLLEFRRMFADFNVTAYAKLESRNPGGSVKDRIARAMIDDAEARGVIRPGVTRIVESTSGNTGVALAMNGAERGYRVALTMPESMSIERRKLLAMFGAEIVLTPRAGGMAAALAAAEAMVVEDPESWMPGQFENPANPAAHRATTGPEILEALDGVAPDYFVAGVGTGGTVSGVGRYLREQGAETTIVAVEPEESPIISQTLRGDTITPAPHGIQGIGANFIPRTLDLKVVDNVIAIPTCMAVDTARLLAEKEGISAGISSGAAVAGALRIAEVAEPGSTIVVILPDTGERYFSTPLWDNLKDVEA